MFYITTEDVVHVSLCVNVIGYFVYISVFDNLIWCTIGPKSFLFGTAQFSLWDSVAVNYDYIVANSIISLLIGSRCIPNDTHTLTIVEPIWPMLQFLITLYGTPLAQRASYLALHSSLFGPVNYDNIVTGSNNPRCIPNGAHINHC